MAVSSGKLRILYIMKILFERTDEDHVMSAASISEALQVYGASADRKTVYNDIETLQEFGIDILQAKGASGGYYIGRRKFELPELKLLVDAVQVSKFITGKKSIELIKKLESLSSENEARQLQRNVFIYNRPKTGNEKIYYNVDQIHTAILNERKITFQYTEWTVEKKLRPKRDGKWYSVSPWALTWADENYYLIAYDEAANLIKHYRVDKMQRLVIDAEKREGEEEFWEFDLAKFSKKMFAMYGGQDEEVTLLCRNEIVGVVLDRFGRDTILIPCDDEGFKAKVLVAVSPQFFGWVTGVGDKMQIMAPKEVREEYKKYLESVIKRY